MYKSLHGYFGVSNMVLPNFIEYMAGVPTETVIPLPAISVKGIRRQVVPITSSDLDAALTRDRE